MRSMPSSFTPARIAISAAIFVLAVVGALALLRGSEPAPATKAHAKGPAPTSRIWAPGDTWVVKVAQDSSSISPDTTRSVSNVSYRFRVEGAPKSAGGEWGVFVSQDGAEGPFADGWHLRYTATDKGCMRLTHVAQGKQRQMEASVASIVLGLGFPYETTYCAAPKPVTTVDATKLMARQSLPPASLPAGGGTNGATPPVNAPNVAPGQLPPGVPPGA